MSYAQYKFRKAIRSLGVLAGQKRNWLASSYVARIVRLDASTIPAEIREEFRCFQHDMTGAYGSDVESSVRATVARMNHAQVIKMILRIISLHDAVRYYENGHEWRQVIPANRESLQQVA